MGNAFFRAGIVNVAVSVVMVEIVRRLVKKELTSVFKDATPGSVRWSATPQNVIKNVKPIRVRPHVQIAQRNALKRLQVPRTMASFPAMPGRCVHKDAMVKNVRHRVTLLKNVLKDVLEKPVQQHVTLRSKTVARDVTLKTAKSRATQKDATSNATLKTAPQFALKALRTARKVATPKTAR